MSHYTITYDQPLRRDRLVAAAKDAKQYLGDKLYATVLEELRKSRPNRITKGLVKSVLFQLSIYAGVQGVPGHAILHEAWSTKWPVTSK